MHRFPGCFAGLAFLGIDIHSFSGHTAVQLPPTKYRRKGGTSSRLVNRPHMPPTPEQTQNDSGSVLPPFTADCSNNSRVPICTIAFVFLLLAFYALALWDRWLNLKMRESQKLRTQTPMYGATQECSTRPPSINIIPAPPNTGLNNKLSRNQNGFTGSVRLHRLFLNNPTDSKTQSQLPLPSIVLDEDST